MSGDASEADAPPARHVLEQGKRLSESALWRIQRRFYRERGTEAWSAEGIPFHITSNAFIARAYARVAAAFLREAVDGALAATRTDQPFYLIELAAGSGHFGFLFLKRLLALKRAVPALAACDLRYVMTDVAESNLEAWRTHERLRPFVEQGVLDFGLFDIEASRELRLAVSGAVLAPGSVANPVVAFANYAFDSTVQDAFWVEHGALVEGRVTLCSTQAEAAGLDDPGVLGRLSLEWEKVPAGDACYGDPALDAILKNYRERLGDTSFLMPIGAMRCLQSLAEMAAGRLLLLSADKGVTSIAEITGRPEPERVLHGGCFSMPVNFDALGAWVASRGGFSLHTSQRDQHLRVWAGILGATALPDTRLCFEQAIESFGPFDYYNLVKGLDKDDAPMSQILAVLKLSDYDYKVVYDFSESLARQAESAPELLREELQRALARTWEHFFPVDRDLAFAIGRLLAVMQQPIEALKYYKESLRLFGAHPATYFQMAMCLHGLQQPEPALQYLERALALNPGYGPARQWRNRIQEDRRAQSAGGA